MFACDASVDVYNYEKVEEEVTGHCIRMFSGIQSGISDDMLESLYGVRGFFDVPVFQNLISSEVVREMSRRKIDILLDLMQRTLNHRNLEISEKFWIH